MERNSIGMMIFAAVAILLGVVLSGIISDSTAATTTLSPTVDTIDIGAARYYSRSTVNATTTDFANVNNSVGGFVTGAGYKYPVCYINNVTNTTGLEMVNSGNWTFVSSTCFFNLTQTTNYNNTALTVNYNFTWMNNDGTINATYPIATLANAIYTGNQGYGECLVSTIVYKNQSGATLTDPTNYVFVMDVATLTLRPSVGINNSKFNTTTATYSYCADGYVGGWAQTTLRLVPGFFALALFGVALFVMYNVLQKEGILSQ